MAKMHSNRSYLDERNGIVSKRESAIKFKIMRIVT